MLISSQSSNVPLKLIVLNMLQQSLTEASMYFTLLEKVIDSKEVQCANKLFEILDMLLGKTISDNEVQ